MYKIPLTNSPNQVFSITVPVNGDNQEFVIELNYNEIAKYWSMSVSDAVTEEIKFTNLPMLPTTYAWANMIYQLDYKEIGSIIIAIIQETPITRPDDTDLGTKYILVWEDNVELAI